MKGYEKALDAGLAVTEIPKFQRECLANALQIIRDEVHASFVIIEMLLMRSKTNKINEVTLKSCTIKNCIELALERYPFKGEDKALVHWHNEKDFNFIGDEMLTIHIFFNLLKNAIYFIKAANKGQIDIWVETGKKYNKVYFKDTGSGIPAKILPNIFEAFFTKSQGGTGAGLAFCKQVMLGFGGDINCKAKEGKYTQFELKFPPC